MYNKMNEYMSLRWDMKYDGTLLEILPRILGRVVYGGSPIKKCSLFPKNLPLTFN